MTPKRTVFIVHPNYDYGIHSIHDTKEGAEAERDRHEESEYQAYIKRCGDTDPDILLKRKDFIIQHYIQEVEIQP